MHAIAWDGDCWAPLNPSSPLFSGNTTLDTSCGGAIVPSNNRGFWTDMGRCIVDLTLVGEDGFSGTGDDIAIRRVGFTVWPDNKEYNKVTIQFDLGSTVWEEGGFATDRIDALGTPSPAGFTIEVCKSDIAVKQRQRGRKKIVGWITMGHITYVPKD